MIKWILLAAIIVFYGIRWRPSVLRRVEKKDINITYLFGEVLLILLVVFQLAGMDNNFKFQVPIFVNYFGLAVALIGAVIASAARIILKNNYVPATVAVTPKSLTTNGLYKIVRHPSYIGTLIAFIGFELALNSYLIWLAVILLMIIIYQANKEEKILLKVYQDEWKEFSQKTPYKLIPFIY